MNEYRYYTLYREPAPGAIPRLGLKEVECFGEKKQIANMNIRAWGYAEYDRRLTANEIRDYELWEAIGGSDNNEEI